MVGSRPSNRSDKASRRQLPNQPVPKKANANTSIIHQGIANAEDGIHLLPSIGTKRVVTSGPPQLRSISASLCYRKQVDYMEEGRLLISADIAANTHTSTCQMGVRTGNPSYGLPKKRSAPFPTLHPHSKLTFKKGLPTPNSEYAKMEHPNL